MSAAKLNFLIEQGATFRKEFTLKDSETSVALDLTGWTITGQIRRTPAYPTALVVFTVTLLDQTSDTGKFQIALTATQTSALPYDEQFYYDVEALKLDGDTDRLLSGRITVGPEVTR